MARQRCLPTNFFKDPDVMALSNGDARLILVGLILNADDEGRGLAHAAILGRELDYPLEVIEEALVEIEACDLAQCYQVERHRYYCLRRWHDWQTLSKPTPSRFPAPPPPSSSGESQGTPGVPHNPQGSPGFPRDIPPEEEGEMEAEPEAKRTEGKGEGEGDARSKVVSFPTARTSSTSPEQHLEQSTLQLAHILKIAVSPALVRIAEEYLEDPLLSLLGEADAAREYIDDRQRNRKGQRMTPAFFRRWLKREHEDALVRRARSLQATGTTGREGTHSATAPPGSAA
ncbi:MAG TPA: hypothetical protein VKR83_05985, partial [Ktedonobacteraceae bacterium]|nr:hypothetical protein [Ktedonobacteraceae bacterium]